MSPITEQQNLNRLVISYLTLRKAVGFLGILLPIVLIVGSFLFGACTSVQDSISDYHNTNMRDVFVGILCAISLFLFAYNGYDLEDRIAAMSAGLLGFIVAIIHDGLDEQNSCTIYPLQNIPSWFPLVHLIAAGLFFLILAYFSIFLFTKSDVLPQNQTTTKKLRNKIYRICGYVIVICVILLLVKFVLTFAFANLVPFLKPYKIVLILEIIMLWAFGFAWIVKGEFILQD
ncbi:MAG: DUF998 domain-containing protein [Bacteroidia bacterium]